MLYTSALQIAISSLATDEIVKPFLIRPLIDLATELLEYIINIYTNIKHIFE